MKLDLGDKAVAALRIAEAQEMDPEEYARRQTAAFRRFKEKPVLVKLDELRARRYVERVPGGFHAYSLTDKGRVALAAHMAIDLAPLVLEPPHIDEILTRLDAAYPEEGVGAVLEQDGAPWTHVLLENIQSILHGLDPEKFPQSGRTAYAIHPDEAKDLFRRRAEGWRLSILYHSHVETLPVFSAEDESRALVKGEPLFPEAVYLIAARSQQGGSNAIAAYRWSPRAGEYVGVPIEIDMTGVAAGQIAVPAGQGLTD